MFEEISFAQKQRLAYIDFSLMFKGAIFRQDLINRFEVGLSAGSRDFKLYKEFAPNNFEYNTQQKRYFQTPEFKPLFDHDAKRTLIKLANDISDGFDAIGDSHFPVESSTNLNIPDINIVAKLVQAIFNKNATAIVYTSLSSGTTTREIVPHNIVDNGLRWHVRAYDRKSNSFRDFVLTRVSNVSLKGASQANELAEMDTEWQRLIPLQLVPHPKNVKYPAAIQLDYAMHDGQRIVKVRSAMAGYLLRRWNVDCTECGTLKGEEYQLWLQNRSALKDVGNLAIAPGFIELRE